MNKALDLRSLSLAFLLLVCGAVVAQDEDRFAGVER